MFTYEQRLKAVKLYVQYGHRATPVICELGYPKSATSLNLWLKEFEENGDLTDGFHRKPKYTLDQRIVAVKHYIENGKSVSRTCRELGYPSRPLLTEWIKEDCPELLKIHCRTNKPLINLSQDKKKQAVIDMCTHVSTVQEIANQYGISRPTVYAWRRQFLGEGVPDIMAKNDKVNKVSEFNTDDKEELLSEVGRLKKEALDLQKQADDLKAQVYRLQLEKDILEKASEVLKKDQGVNLTNLTNHEKAIVIDALKDKYKINEMLSLLNMAKSSYYYQEMVLNASDKYSDLREHIRQEFSCSGCCYGYRRIHMSLKKAGIMVSEKIVRRIMREEALIVVLKKQRKYSSYKGEISPAVPNIIDRDFHAEKPNEKWLTDITEFHIPAGKVYLSPIIDCFDGLPVSWTIGTSPDAQLVNTMLDAAINTLNEKEHPIVHSDRGCHYRWPGWIQRMEAAGLIRSMSKKGCSPDNSACEGFFGRLKNEMFYGRDWKGITIEDFIERLDRYMHWYAEKRIKLSLNGLSPIEYRRSLGLIN